MFAYNTFIDTIQNSKKFFVNTFITDEKVRKPMLAFVDAQTTFTKQIVKSNEEVTAYVKEEATNLYQKGITK
jgi:hypothetical protein